MSKHDHLGKRKTREQLSSMRPPELGYYYIVTDTEETEKNYISGIRESIPEELRRKLVIKVKPKSKDIISDTLEGIAGHAQYAEPWAIFDRDKVKDFDQKIAEAEAKGINVGWSNPCIEEWFSAYFGTMPAYSDSVSCCQGFASSFKKQTGQEYSKADPAIYQKLLRFGNEVEAIAIARRRMDEHLRNGICRPSDQCPATTLHLLLSEIQQKAK